MEKNILTTVEEYLKKLCYGESTGHDWWHIKRVQNLALKINQEEKQDEFTIKMIALSESSFSTLNELERNTIMTYNSFATGYNKTRGNRG